MLAEESLDEMLLAELLLAELLLAELEGESEDCCCSDAGEYLPIIPVRNAAAWYLQMKRVGRMRSLYYKK